jgi:glycerol-3-phosphate dehydrogenase
MYDVLAGKENMESSYLMSKGKALETFPMLKSEGLVGALVYYDGRIPLRIYIHILSQCCGARSTQ